jgi:maltose-binding protein MalE
LTQAGKQAPKTFDEFLTLATQMKAAGSPFTVSLPNHGAKEFFNWMVAESKGATYLQKMMNGQLDWDNDGMEAAIGSALDLATTVLDVSTYVGGSDILNQQDAEEALNSFIAGTTSMFLYPDWMKSWLTGKGWTAGTDFGIETSPLNASAGSIYTYIVDAFLVPKQATHLDNANKFIEAISSASAIAAVINIKESNSPRTDISADQLDPVAQEALNEMKNSSVLNADATPASNAYVNILDPNSATSIDDILMAAFVKGYKDAACTASACKATFISKFKALWPTVVALK